MPGMQGSPGGRRPQARRGREVRMPEMRTPFLGLLVDVAFILEADAGEDKGDTDPDNDGLPRLGGRRDRRGQREDGPVLGRQMPRRGLGMVERVEAFGARLDRRDALRPDEGDRLRRRGLDHLRRQDSQGRVHGSRLRRVGPRLLPPLRLQARDALEGDGHRMPVPQDRARVDAHPRRGEQPQRDRRGALAGRRLGQVRRGRRRIREEDEAHEQLLLVPQALLRVAQRHKVHQARGLRELLPLPLEPRQETRPKGDRRLPVQPRLRNGEKRRFLKLVLKRVDGMGLSHPSFAGISRFERGFHEKYPSS